MSLKALCLALTVSMAAGVSVTAAAQQYDPAAEEQLVQLVNQERARFDMSPLVIDKRLRDIARQHSEIMAQKHSLSHQFSGEKTVRERVAGTGIRFNFSGENVAYDSEVKGVHEGLMFSPPHRENILRPQFNSIGIGVVKRGNVYFVTQDFARRLPEVSVDDAERTIADRFAQVRKQAGARPLRRIERPELRDVACGMARNDSLSPKQVQGMKNAHHVVLWTSTELEDIPDSLTKLKKASASGYSLAACLASSSSYPNPVYWIALVTYY